MAAYAYISINVFRGWTNNGNTRKYRNKTVCFGCTERILVVSFFIPLFVLCSASVNRLQIVFSNSLYESTAKWETNSYFQRGQIVGAPLAGASVTKTTTLLGISRAAVSMVMTTCKNHGRTSSAKRKSGQKPKITERDHYKLKRIVSINHRSTAAKVTAELNIHLEDCFHKNSVTRASQIQLLNFLLLNTALKGEEDDVMITKLDHLIGNT